MRFVNGRQKKTVGKNNKKEDHKRKRKIILVRKAAKAETSDSEILKLNTYILRIRIPYSEVDIREVFVSYTDRCILVSIAITFVLSSTDSMRVVENFVSCHQSLQQLGLYCSM